ncbi:alpha-D-ribose 1-methylphosphonate 5-triphosphate synthase subunit PhnG [Rhizobium sp. RU35A]|uniref:Phosphonate C-P lyase system protein PhnG n=1 Tax=Rhizobium straminoryzae TaxID=1387186 RepID=A0A549THR4_9HYPH|nr:MULTISPECIES: phosphonate C-P lyase system protein PhnG [Rhizobium]TRL42642.1 phosphonate C-P lyase system protein PhnG [Rhizobium straminoryzae]SIQ90094.1 alpha-D-ribose 1-methylphosphonate 5-triphosphate synthase subunit PhnG [Rhizobium sp. RU35A]
MNTAFADPGHAGPAGGGEEEARRKRDLDLLARASRTELEDLWNGLDDKPAHTRLRGPETGLVMVRGRIGGGGAPFNLGEATVSRASVQLADGAVGHAYRLGTDRRAAELAAIIDALARDDGRRAVIADRLLTPLAERLAAEAAGRAEETAATKVDFFTMVRGED